MSEGHCLVTGGSQGVGRLLAEALLVQGQRVSVLDRQEPEVCPSTQLSYQFHKVDVGDELELKDALSQSRSRWGPAGRAFLTASYCPQPVPVDEVDSMVWRRTIDTNLKGTWLCLKHLLPAMARGTGVAQGTGVAEEPGAAIVCFSSSLAVSRGLQGTSAYTASKRAITEIVRAASLEAPWVRVNAVCPGQVDSNTLDQLGLQALSESSLQDVVELALWLASPASKGVNGQSIKVG